MAATEDLEKGGQTSRPLGSSSTSANASRNPSAQSSPFSSRNSSTEQLNLRPMKFVKESSRHTHRFLSHELDASWMGGIVIICFFTSGLIDSVAFNTWNCFVGMQTGSAPPSSLSRCKTDSSCRQYRFRSSRIGRPTRSNALSTVLQVACLDRSFLSRCTLLQRPSPLSHGAEQPSLFPKKMDLRFIIPPPGCIHRHCCHSGLLQPCFQSALSSRNLLFWQRLRRRRDKRHDQLRGSGSYCLVGFPSSWAVLSEPSTWTDRIADHST